MALVWYLGAAYGALGGFLRAILGVRKAVVDGKPFNFAYFVNTVIIAAIVGVITTLAPGSHAWMCVSTGYLGDDAIQGLLHMPPKTSRRKGE